MNRNDPRWKATRTAATHPALLDKKTQAVIKELRYLMKRADQLRDDVYSATQDMSLEYIVKSTGQRDLNVLWEKATGELEEAVENLNDVLVTIGQKVNVDL